MTIRELKQGIVDWRFTRERAVNLSVGVTAVLIYEFLARPVYRPYIYRNQINDLHLADTIGNSLGTAAAIFMLIGIFGQQRAQHMFLIKTITISIILYEVAQPLFGRPIDPWDIFATMITAGLCVLLYKTIHPEKSH